MSLTEKDPNNVEDEHLKKLMLSAKNIQDSLLEYANSKPIKVASSSSSNIEDSKTRAMRNLIDRILDFK